MDEHAQGMVLQIINKVLLTFEYFSDNLSEEYVLPVLSVIGTVLFIVGAGFLMSYLVRVEEENVQKRKNKASSNNNGSISLGFVKTGGPLLTFFSCWFFFFFC